MIRNRRKAMELYRAMTVQQDKAICSITGPLHAPENILKISKLCPNTMILKWKGITYVINECGLVTEVCDDEQTMEISYD